MSSDHEVHRGITASSTTIIRGVFLVAISSAAALIGAAFKVIPEAPMQDSAPLMMPSESIEVSEKPQTKPVELLQAIDFSSVLPSPPRHIDFDNSTDTDHFLQFLTPIRDMDREYYTIRINTYQRHAQLALSVFHHLTCPGVAQIQIIWSEPGDPPPIIMNLMDNPKVVLEAHSDNSLNERFRILRPPLTLGILSMDDDVLTPCLAIDSAFFQWTLHPTTMVGFDARAHAVKKGEWFYRGDYQLQTLGYSMVLSRYCFLHRDYLHWYMTAMPSSIRKYVKQKLNCEDLAMSMFVTKLSGGSRPILADEWARWSQIELPSHNEISNKKRHRLERRVCLNEFIDPLGVRHSMTLGPALGWNESYMDTVDLPNPRYQVVKQFWKSCQHLTGQEVNIKLRSFKGKLKQQHQAFLEAWNITELIKY
jgi:glucuronyl/N-acetylglucosaminyl transferase EXT2